MGISLKQLIQLYSNNETNLHHLASHSTPCCPRHRDDGLFINLEAGYMTKCVLTTPLNINQPTNLSRIKPRPGALTLSLPVLPAS